MRILIVDDEAFFREIYQRALREEARHTVEACASTDEALARFEEGGIDLVVTDLVMPGRDGLALVAALRERDPELPIVVVSQREEIRAVVEAGRLGVHDYLVKPVEPELLRIAVQRAADDARLKRESRRLREENLSHLRTEGVYRACLRLADCLDVDRLQDRLLAAVASLTGAQGTALWHGGSEGKRPFTLRAISGLVDRDSLPRDLSLDDDSSRSTRLLDGAPHVEDGRLLHAPLVVDGTVIGVVMATDRLAGPFTPADAALVRTLCDFAAIALRNALRVGHLRRGGLRDRETAAYNISYFIDYAGKEIYKARRYGRRFSLVTIQVDNLEVLRRAVSDTATRTVHRALIGAVQQVIRDSDILAKVTDDTFYLLLPETDYFGAQMFTRRALAGFVASPRVASLSVPPSVAVGAATYPKDGDDFDELLACCRKRQEEARQSPYRRLRLEDHGFWGMVDTLLDSPAVAAATGESGRREKLPEGILDAALVESARDLAREPSARGLVYYGAAKVGPKLPLLRALDGFQDTATRLYLLGREVTAPVDHAAVATVSLPDEARLDDGRFFLLLTEHAAYAWLDRGRPETYHTSDASLVEALVARLQETYALQRQF
jgi:two-component system, cell cycle response regulator